VPAGEEEGDDGEPTKSHSASGDVENRDGSRWWDGDLFPSHQKPSSHQALNAFLYQIDID